MNAKDVILNTIGMGDFLLNTYLADLSDADLLIRPVPGTNHIAWQLGHMIVGERHMVEGVKPGSSPALPEGFEEAHSKEASRGEDTSRFLPETRYRELWKEQRAATKRVLESLSDADLDGPAPESFRSFCPTVGSVMNLVGTHMLMHVGQFVAVRRTLGKPVTV